MKKHIKLLTIGTLLLGGLTGCNDFLDREPLDKVIPEKYFASESDLAAYTITIAKSKKSRPKNKMCH